MKVGLYGGTFDPIHHGHLITASIVKEIRQLDKIILMPCYVSPLRQDEKRSSPFQRFNMIAEAIVGVTGFEVSDLEIKNQNVSYTIDTLKILKKVYNNIELIIGFDNLLVFEKWKNPDEIFELSTVIVLNRKTEGTATKNKYFDKSVFVETPTIEISSTEIRNRVSKNQTIEFLVPQRVKEYIYKNKLYT